VVKRTATAFIVFLIFILIASCGEDPQKPEENDNGIDWPEMTNREDVIETVLLAYANPRIAESTSRYEDILHSEYFFMLAPRDVYPGNPPFLSRSEDIASTEWIFDHQILLELSIAETGSWDAYPEIGGEECTGCMATTRDYFIRAQFGGGETIYQSSPTRCHVTIIVSPDESDPSKWALRAMYDIVD
jgi:hypothetical protein